MSDYAWGALCVFLVIPFGAMLHNALFYYPTCMLKPFGEDYYIGSVFFKWLSRDPSLPWAIVVALCVYHFGKRYQKIKIFAAPIFISFLPLSLWIWDIPFTGRFICDYFHDSKVLLFGDYPLKSRYFYIIGIITYISFLVHLTHKLTRRKYA